MKSKDLFAFSAENARLAQKIIAQYPHPQSAMLPLLDLAQRQCGGWLPRNAIEYIAQMMNVHQIKVYEIASFYTMFNLNPVGAHRIQICTTTPCWLVGSDKVHQACKQELEVDYGETTKDKLFTLQEVQCLGACCDGPVVQINDEIYERVSAQKIKDIIRKVRSV